MIAVDSNLLIYSHREDCEFHAPAKELIDSLRHQSTPWAIPWPCIHEFIGVVSHNRIFRPPSTLSKTFAAVEAWMASSSLHILSESPGYLKNFATWH